jgi:hypothetical protein
MAEGRQRRKRCRVRPGGHLGDDHPGQADLERRPPRHRADVQFFYNLVKANKEDWANYNAGQAPDNWTSLTVADDTHLTITFDKPYNTDWMLANELSLITPLPQHVWDKTSTDGAVGDYASTPDGAVKVWDYLNKAAGDVSGYAANPLWKVVDGPYALSGFTTAGKVTLQANAKYDGGDKPTIKTVNLLPFTSADAEENALRGGQIDYGYISPTSMDDKKSFEAKGYQITPWTGWAITYLPYNFNNPTMGPVFAQLYARQAIQQSIDQNSLVKAIFNDTAVAGYGPIPQATKNDFVSSVQSANPYPFSTSAATKLLTDHGWQHGPDGIMVCRDAGSAANQCGAGVPAGTTFTMAALSQSGSPVTDNEMSALQSSLKDSGIGFTIRRPGQHRAGTDPAARPTSRSAPGSCRTSAPRAAGTSPPTPRATRCSRPAAAPTSAATTTRSRQDDRGRNTIHRQEGHPGLQRPAGQGPAGGVAACAGIPDLGRPVRPADAAGPASQLPPRPLVVVVIADGT